MLRTGGCCGLGVLRTGVLRTGVLRTRCCGLSVADWVLRTRVLRTRGDSDWGLAQSSRVGPQVWVARQLTICVLKRRRYDSRSDQPRDMRHVSKHVCHVAGGARQRGRHANGVGVPWDRHTDGLGPDGIGADVTGASASARLKRVHPSRMRPQRRRLKRTATRLRTPNLDSTLELNLRPRSHAPTLSQIIRMRA